jgi:hypothetical protein
MWHRVRRLAGVAVFALVCSANSFVFAVDPTALESAYWRFEEGLNGASVPAPLPEPGDDGDAFDDGDYDTVLDSLNNNNLRNSGNAPIYTNDVAPTPLKSGAANNLAMSFTPNSGLVTFLRNIDNGIIEPGNGFTIEAAFRANSLGSNWQGILSKQGEPDDANPDPILGNLPTIALKISGVDSRLMYEQYDTDKNLVTMLSANPIAANNWYYAAVVNDGSQVSFYLDSNDGNGYQLQSTAAVSGAIYMGPQTPDPENPDYVWPDWNGAWSVGRGYFAGANDWFNGTIDEVRITNSALNPADFLFAPGAPNGDFNGDQIVDAADYVQWRKQASFDLNAYADWHRTFGESTQGGGGSTPTPEPASLSIVAILLFAAVRLRRPRATQDWQRFSTCVSSLAVSNIGRRPVEMTL